MNFTYDIETLKNLFVYCAVDDNDEWYEFRIGHDRNDLTKLYSFLNDHIDDRFIGFNNLKFDAQVIEWMRRDRHEFVGKTPEEIAGRIHAEAQAIIEELMQRFWDTDLTHPQMDLFRIMHFDNPARSTSLKALQVAMRWPNVQDMPFSHLHMTTPEQADEIAAYCRNDVLSTREFMGRIQTEIQLRADLSKTYGIDFTNMSDSTLGERLMGSMIADLAGIHYAELKKNPGTHRDAIKVSDILLPYINFRDPTLRDLLSKFRKTVIADTKGAFSHEVEVGNLVASYGTGGVHACIEPGVYEASEHCVIRDIDVASFYPNLAIQNQWKPEHLGNTFANVYRNIYEQRKQFPKKDPRNTAFKLALNSVYGKTNSRFSWLYDPQFTMQITINGQLLITMLAERLYAAGCRLIQINTDGLTISYPPDLGLTVDGITARWQKLTSLVLEDAYYSKMVIANVSNYIAIATNGSIKQKGGSFVEKPEWHKDPSSVVIQKAVTKYFTDGVDPVETIENHEDPWDFLIRYKFKGSAKGFQRSNTGDEIELQKTVRYYASTDGMALFKRMERSAKAKEKGYFDEDVIEEEEECSEWTTETKLVDQVLSGNTPVTIANVYNGEPLAGLNRQYYVDEAWNIINSVLVDESKEGAQASFSF